MTAIQRVDENERRERLDLIKRTFAAGATDDEFSLFIKTTERLGLDVFARQAFLVKRYSAELRCEVATTQVSIDGFRVIAERTGKYEGQTPPQWCGEDGVWRDVWLSKNPPCAARVGAFRNGHREPTFGVATYSSFAQIKRDGQPMRMWATMPDVMLLKCAEAQALRKAFPQDLAGVYAPEEMDQADNHIDVEGHDSTGTRALSAEVREVTSQASEAQARHRNESDAMADEWGPMIAGLASEEDIARFAHFHGYAWHRMHTNARSKVYRLLKEKCIEHGVKKPVIDGWLRDAPDMTEADDGDA